MELKADRNIFAEIFIAFLFTEISHISGSFIGNGTVMVLCPLSLSCTLSFLTEAFLWTGREPSVWNEHMGLICSSLSDWWPGGSPIFSSPENRALKNNLLISLLKKMLPSSTFSEFPDPPTLFPLLTLLWQLVVLIVLNMKWKGYYIFELFLRLLGHLSIFSSFLGSSLISLPWINWKFLEEMEMLLGVIFDWILCVIEVRECWEVVSEEILPLFDIAIILWTSLGDGTSPAVSFGLKQGDSDFWHLSVQVILIIVFVGSLPQSIP